MNKEELEVGNWYHNHTVSNEKTESKKTMVIDEINEDFVLYHYLDNKDSNSPHECNIKNISPAPIHSHHLSYLFKSPHISPLLTEDIISSLYNYEGVYYEFDGVEIYECEIKINEINKKIRINRRISNGMNYVHELQNHMKNKEVN